MFPDLITPASDFEHQLGACVNAMSQEDAIGQILVFERMSGTLHKMCIRDRRVPPSRPRPRDLKVASLRAAPRAFC